MPKAGKSTRSKPGMFGKKGATVARNPLDVLGTAKGKQNSPRHSRPPADLLLLYAQERFGLFLAVSQFPEVDHPVRSVARLALECLFLRGDLVVEGEDHRLLDRLPAPAVFHLRVLCTLLRRRRRISRNRAHATLFVDCLASSRVPY